MAKLANADLRRYALVGAEKRLIELGTEAAQIFRAFPELRARGRGFDAVGRAPASGDPARPVLPRRRRTISAAGRKRISDAQKARWAKQRGQAAARVGDGRKKR